MPDIRPLEDLSATGVLWFINTVLHQRGVGFALAYNDAGAVVGWALAPADPINPDLATVRSAAFEVAVSEALSSAQPAAEASFSARSYPDINASDLGAMVRDIVRASIRETIQEVVAEQPRPAFTDVDPHLLRPVEQFLAPAPVPADSAVILTHPSFQRASFAASFDGTPNDACDQSGNPIDRGVRW